MPERITYEDDQRQVIRYWTDNPDVYSEREVWKPGSPPANALLLKDKLANAIGGNVAYLALPAPTAAQTTAQTKALTRQVTALLRLAADRADDTAGT